MSKQITAWGLRKELSKVLADVALGESYLVQKHGKVIAQICPPPVCQEDPERDCAALVDPFTLPPDVS